MLERQTRTTATSAIGVVESSLRDSRGQNQPSDVSVTYRAGDHSSSTQTAEIFGHMTATRRRLHEADQCRSS